MLHTATHGIDKRCVGGTLVLSTEDNNDVLVERLYSFDGRIHIRRLRIVVKLNFANSSDEFNSMLDTLETTHSLGNRISAHVVARSRYYSGKNVLEIVAAA